jgi:hypothetical protein
MTSEEDEIQNVRACSPALLSTLQGILRSGYDGKFQQMKGPDPNRGVNREKPEDINDVETIVDSLLEVKARTKPDERYPYR